MAKRRQAPVDERFVMFDDALECAKAAAPVFVEQRWRWTFLPGFPKEHNILDTLLRLRELAAEGGDKYAETGNLVYCDGRYGYHRPKGTLDVH